MGSIRNDERIWFRLCSSRGCLTAEFLFWLYPKGYRALFGRRILVVPASRRLRALYGRLRAVKHGRALRALAASRLKSLDLEPSLGTKLWFIK